MNWKILAIATPLLFVSYQALSKFLPKGTSIFLINAYASFVGVVVMLALYWLTSPVKSVALSSRNVAFAAGIGLLISLGNYGIIKAYSLGAPQSIFTPLFYTALIVYGVLFGLLIFHERLNAMQVVGMLLAVTGLAMTAFFRK